MNKILFITPMKLNPMHIRVEMINDILKKNNYKVLLVNLNKKSIFNKVNYLTLGFFNLVAMFKSIYVIVENKDCNIVYITDLQYLPISLIAKILGKKVIYETLDNNVELHFYNLSKKISYIKNFKLLKKIFVISEKFFSKYFVDEIIVNSKALQKYFFPIKVNIIYYSSPFENKFPVNYSNNEIVGLYLGLFSKEKGANEILDFCDQNQIKLFIYGDIIDDNIRKKVFKKKDELIFYKPRLDSKELEKELKTLFNNYKLIGYSLIKPVHYSYATQEANKDIDYLAMGIPIVGNNRLPTKEKIEKECGVFYNDGKRINELLRNQEFYKNISNNCKKYYFKFYSRKIFEKNLLKIIKRIEQ